MVAQFPAQAQSLRACPLPLGGAVAQRLRGFKSAEPEKLAQGADKALAAISGCTAAVSTPCAEDLCNAHYEVVQAGRSAAAMLAVTTAGYVRTRVARVRTGLSEHLPRQHRFHRDCHDHFLWRDPAFLWY